MTYKYHFGINEDYSSKEINMSRGGHIKWRLEAMQVIFLGTKNKLWYLRYRVRSSCPLISDDRSFIYHTVTISKYNIYAGSHIACRIRTKITSNQRIIDLQQKFQTRRLKWFCYRISLTQVGCYFKEIQYPFRTLDP